MLGEDSTGFHQPLQKDNSVFSDASWQPTASIQAIQLRAQVLKRLRAYFDQRGMLEVQTPLLSRDTVVDRHLDPIQVAAQAVGTARPTPLVYYLQTSPEFGMKRLLAAGVPALYQIGSVFRAFEEGPFHNPEFTMVEWYRTGDDLEAGVSLLAELTKTILEIDEVSRETYQAAFLRTAGVDPLDAPLTELKQLAQLRLGIAPNWSEDRDDWLNLLFAEIVQPELGQAQPTIVTHYPASQSALARIAPEDGRVSERFELFAGGVELANGYHELVDADELEARNEIVNRQRQGDGKQPLPASSRLIDAMRAGLPACSGCALGLDRLLMVMLGAQELSQVLPFPISRA